MMPRTDPRRLSTDVVPMVTSTTITTAETPITNCRNNVQLRQVSINAGHSAGRSI